MIAERIREARAAGRPLRVLGAGTWADAGRQVRADDTLSLAGHSGIVEYVPGDLTLTARAGTRLADIRAVTEREGQWLPLDPWGGDDGTIGATISTASPGPLSHAFGLPRDVVLGLEFVTGAGDVIRAGGRVVKNVAGFDLTRLLVGSWGTLGVITEVTVRLRGRPERTRSAAITIGRAPEALANAARCLRALPFEPLACEVISAGLAEHLDAGTDPVLLVLLGGNAKAVEAQWSQLGSVGKPRDVADDVWMTLRVCDREKSTWRVSQLPAVFAETWRMAADGLPSDRYWLHGNPLRGVVRVIATRAETPARIPAAVTTRHATVIPERLPGSTWSAMPPFAADALSRAVRAKFDPAGILNPGILGGDA